ncbi:uncharacterized protein LOC120349726 [Nilaparvata lugens]|uniref:uncharacterized protein LOC120349726 n=1 Tax=Nilaparvata lugens TaxID=108931 RepID=UPI00193DDECC|nr:uncharacterized protein LOC120349726 [Nilaparvata lugens]
MKSPYVSNCCCINDVTRGLVLFYQADNFQIEHNSQLKFWLKNEGLLPNNASVPDTLIQLHELPLNCNGKIDRSQLEKILRETDPSETNSTLKIPFRLHLRSLWISCTSGSSVDFEEKNENSDKIDGRSSVGFIHVVVHRYQLYSSSQNCTSFSQGSQ